MTELPRKPEIVRADDPRLLPSEPFDPPSQRPEDAVAERVDMLIGASTAAARRPGWATLFWSALSGFVLLGLGVAVETFIADLFGRTYWLGALGVGLAAVAGLALLVLIVREVLGLVKLARVETLRTRALAVIDSDDRIGGQRLVDDLLSLTASIPQLARGRARLSEHRSDIIDGRDRVRLAEQELMAPLDAEARRLIVAAGKRVSVVTAISPRAAVDMLFVLFNAVSLIRRLATLYGARPGPLGVLKLLRQVVSHLAVTGGVAVTDSLVQQLIGHGLAARLSARLGEGMINGLLTARLGLLALDEVRPLPFYKLPQPRLQDLAGTLLRAEEKPAAPAGPGTPPPLAPS